MYVYHTFLKNSARSCSSPIGIKVIPGLQTCAWDECLIYCKWPQLCACLFVNSVLLNLFDVAAHFSPRLWFWAHFTKDLFQNSWLGIPITFFKKYVSYLGTFAAHLKELRGPPVGHGPRVEKRCVNCLSPAQLIGSEVCLLS